MAKHTVTMNIHKDKFGDGFSLFTTEVSEYGYALVGPTEVTFEVPDDFDPRLQQIKALQAQQRQAAADFEKLCTDIKRQISELSAIEYVAAV